MNDDKLPARLQRIKWRVVGRGPRGWAKALGILIVAVMVVVAILMN